MGFKFKRLIRNIPKIAAVGAAVYFGAPYAASILSGAKTVASVAGPLLQARASMGGAPSGGMIYGGGTAPSGGEPIIINTGFQPGLSGGFGGGFSEGGTIGAMYGGGGGPQPSAISPGLMIGLAAGGLGLVVLMALLRR